MSSISSITNNSSSPHQNIMQVDFSSTDSKVETAAKVIQMTGKKRKGAQSKENHKSQKTHHKPQPQSFTWSKRHITNFKHERALTTPFNLKDLSDFLEREATPDELLNFQLDRELNTKIREDDPGIPVCYLINWKLLKSFRKENPELEFDTHLNRAVTWDALRDYLKTPPTLRQHLNCLLKCKPADLDNPEYKKFDITPFSQINLNKNRDLFTRPTMEEVAEFFQSPPCWQDHCSVINLKKRFSQITFEDLKNYLWGRDPTSDEIFNWIEDRDLNREITQEEFEQHDWRAHVNRCLNIHKEPQGEGIDPYSAKGVHWPVSLENLRKCLPDATCWQQFNCNRGKSLTEPVFDEDVNGYLESNQISYFQGWTNFALNRDPAQPITLEDLDHPHWELVVNACLRYPPGSRVQKTDFEKVINRDVTDQEYINCLMRRRLSHPVTEAEIESHLKPPP